MKSLEQNNNEEAYRWTLRELLRLLIECEDSFMSPLEFLKSLGYNVTQEIEDEILDELAAEKITKAI